MEKRELLYEGKAKRVYRTDDPESLIVSYKDDATAFNGLKKGRIAGKGAVNNQMSNRLMRYLEENGVPTHFIAELNERETLVKRVSVIPLEVIVRNIAAGSFSKRYGVEEGVVLDCPTFEFSYKNDALGPSAEHQPRPGLESGGAGGTHCDPHSRPPGKRAAADILGGLWDHSGRFQAGVWPPAERLHRPGG